MKPRPPGSIFDALEQGIGEIEQRYNVPDGVQALAEFLGKTKFTVRHETDPDDSKHTMSVRTLGLIAVHFQMESLAHFFAAAAKGAFLPLPRPDMEPRWAELSARTIEEMAAHMAELVRDLADGKLDAFEARRELIRLGEILRLISHLYSMTLARAEGRS